MEPLAHPASPFYLISIFGGVNGPVNPGPNRPRHAKVADIVLQQAAIDAPKGRGAAASWGRYPLVRQERLLISDRNAPIPIARGDRRTMLPYGNGRSYGDTCLNDGGIVIDCRGLNRILAFDPTTGVIDCEAGVLLSDIIDRALPAGWFLPVTPGTRFVTVAGAVANDVHGKNHHRAGTFGEHVERLELLRSDGTRLVCSRTANADWMRATIGGMGLTGLITTVRLKLRRVASAMMAQTTRKFARLAEFFALVEEADARHEYTVAWIDSLASGDSLGRGLLMSADHAVDGSLARASGGIGWRVPFQPPVALINRASLKAFNTLFYARQRQREQHATIPYDRYFYPLDRIGDWNRLYGPAGLMQHQSVIPEANAPDAVADLLRASMRAGAGSFLTVLKRFGDRPKAGILSFPRGGVTLTLDFANQGERTLALLAELDRITIAAGGAVNPYKDARMSAATFAASFPDWRDILPFKDPRFSSSFWRRVTG
jgi:FAD/FMN-containing dehydrogenase